MTDTYLALQATLLNNVDRLSIISQNLANATTAGYKKQIAVNRSFAEYVAYANVDQMDETNTNLARYGVPYMESLLDPAMGTLKYTGNMLDVVADGNTYFTLLTPQGLAYTKQGSFTVNADGIVVNPLGYPVLSESGEILLNDKQPVINEQGEIIVDNKILARFKTVTFAPDTRLNSIGYGMYRNDDENIEPIDTSVKIKQGYLEMSNVVLMDEMVKMIEVTRQFETAQKFMMGYDDMLDKAINVVGEV